MCPLLQGFWLQLPMHQESGRCPAVQADARLAVAVMQEGAWVQQLAAAALPSEP